MIWPKITVVIPAYNATAWLADCVASLEHAAFPEVEVLLVNDGSTDGTAGLCEELFYVYPRVRVVHQENRGLSGARNSGIRYAAGEYLWFVDADDRIAPGALGRLLEILQSCQPDAVRFGCARIQNGQELRQLLPYAPGLYTGDALREQRLDGISTAYPLDYRQPRFHSACFFLVRRDFLDETGLTFISEREILNEEFLFLMQLLQQVQSVYVHPRAEYLYCIRQGSLSHSYRPQMYARKQALCRAYAAFLPQDDPQIARRLDHFYIDSMYASAIEEIQYLPLGQALPPVRRVLRDEQLQQALKHCRGTAATAKARWICRLMEAKLALGMYILYRLGRRLTKNGGNP